MSSADERRDFVVRCVETFCGAVASKQASSAGQLDNFLNDTACHVLQVYVLGPNASSASPHLDNDEAKEDAVETTPSITSGQIKVSNRLQLDCEGCSGEVHFVKTNTEELTEENIAKSVIVTSQLQGPLTSFYHSLHSVYAPTLLNDSKWATRLDHKTQGLLTDLESGLGAAVRGIGGEAYGRGGASKGAQQQQQLSGILTPMDELLYWGDQVATGGRGRARAQKFHESFERIREFCDALAQSTTTTTSNTNTNKQDTDEGTNGNEVVVNNDKNTDTANPDAVRLAQLYSGLDDVQNAMDDVWKCPDLYDDSDQYPELRMLHFFNVLGVALCQAIQTQLRKLDLWFGNAQVDAQLDEAIRVCEKWLASTNELTGTLWDTNSGADHCWRGDVFEDPMVLLFIRRLEDILRVRATFSELSRLGGGGNGGGKTKINRADAFKAFRNVDALQYNAYTQQLWNSAVTRFDKVLVPLEDSLAQDIRDQVHTVYERKPKQLVQALQRVFGRYKQLLTRPGIAKQLLNEREKFLSHLLTMVEAIEDDVNNRCNEGFDATSTTSTSTSVARKQQRRSSNSQDGPAVWGKNMSPQTNAIMWARQVGYRVETVLAGARGVLSDLSAYSRFEDTARGLSQRIEAFQNDTFREWVQHVDSELDSGTELSLHLTGRLMEIDMNGLLQVNFSDRLVTLLREVRQLSELGLVIPSKIRKISTEAAQYYRFGVMLKKTANYYNQLETRINQHQKAMLYDALVAFEEQVSSYGSSSASGSSNKGITWQDPAECESYVDRLRGAAERLDQENSRLRKLHERLGEQVVGLMCIDLLRQRDKWKKQWGSIQTSMAKLEGTYEPKRMLKWKVHWDQQLYKSLEASYQIGLESLNENLPEIKAELVFSNRNLSFRPAIEELRTSYFKEMRKFVSMPSNFPGLTASKLFTKMTARNGVSLIKVYEKAETLFGKLDALHSKMAPHVVLGSVPDLDQFVENVCTCVEDWEVNFKALKVKRKELDRIPDFVKVDCFAISTMTLKGTIEQQLQRVDDALVLSLRKTLLVKLRKVETDLEQSMVRLRTRPESIEEITDARGGWVQMNEDQKGWRETWKGCEDERKLLLTVASTNSQVNVSEVMALHGRLPSKWENFEVALIAFNDMIEDQREALKARVTDDIERNQKELQGFAKLWHTLKPHDVTDWGDANIAEIFAKLDDWRKQFGELLATIHSTVKSCEHFEMEVPSYPALDDLESDVDAVEAEWNQYREFSGELMLLKAKDWITFRVSLFDAEDLAKRWLDVIKGKARGEVLDRIKSVCDQLRRAMPALKFMRGEPYKEEHWTKLVRKLKMPRGTDLSKLTFGHFVDVIDAVIANLDFAKDMTARAQGEVAIREAIMELKAWSETAVVEMMEHEALGRNTPLIKNFKDVTLELGDNQSLLASLKESQYYKPFEKEATVYETNMAALDVYLSHMNIVQRKWLYLEPIFGRGALPSEQSRFRRVDNEWTDIMHKLGGEALLFNLCDESIFPRMQETLHMMVEQLERCQKALADFLEEKRSKMPRFYFLGDDDLLEILGQSRSPQVIQSHLKKLFQGIHSVAFDEKQENIIAILSSMGEEVPLENQVKVTDEVEVWLRHLNDEAKSTLQALVARCVHSTSAGGKGEGLQEAVEAYPSQVLCLAEQIRFNSRCEHAIKQNKLSSLGKLLKKMLQAHINLLGDSTDLPLVQLKVKALVLDLVHMIDVVEQLVASKVADVGAWMWQKQLRYSLDSSNACVVQMCDAQIEYTYEYWGNAGKLVHTPLTDKCYLTLTQGMHMGFGGSPYGPAGTGKTESVKALGAALGRQVLVFNCDEGIDFQSMGRIFTGLVKCGAWGCFDEFNRLKEDQLSAVSQQIQVIQAAIKERTPMLKLLDSSIEVDFNAGIFVTMNPAGKDYGGRSKLPDNLKQLFRPVAMSRPDNNLIAEVILYSEGFQEARDLGRKMVSLYQLSKELLSTQQHYDWGLRAMKAVLNTGGKLIQHAKRQLAVGGGDSGSLSKRAEREILIKAIRVNTLSKLTFTDSKAFLGLIGDVFPNVHSSDVEYKELEDAIRHVVNNPPFNLEFSEGQVRKMMQLKESLDQRMGCVVVGPSGCGKSTLWRVLRAALNHLAGKVVVKTYVMNPKSMQRERLLGHMDLDTREWTDGVLTAAARQVVREPLETRSWIICDGDVDPEWIESLNSVLDDNKLLTMPNGERISFGPNVNFVFETHDLKYASPATISRMGMIFLSDEDVDVRRLVSCWLKDQQAAEVKKAGAVGGKKENKKADKKNKNRKNSKSEDQVRGDESKAVDVDGDGGKDEAFATRVQSLAQWINDHFYHALDWVLKEKAFVVDTTTVGTVKSGLSQVRDAETKTDFLLGLIRGLGGNLDLETRTAFARELFSHMSEQPPDNRAPLDCYSDRGLLVSYADEDVLQGNFEDLMEGSSGTAVIRTVSVQRHLDTIRPWVENMEPFILVGPEGCGKNMVLRYCFEHVGKNTAVSTLHCNAQTTAQHVIQKIVQACSLFSTNNGRVYRPREGDRLVLYLKDINLPKPDQYDTCMLIAFLQQLINFHGFYDENLEFLGLERVHIVASMNPSTTVGRHPLSTRFTANVRIACIDYPSPKELANVYGCILNSAIRGEDQIGGMVGGGGGSGGGRRASNMSADGGSGDVTTRRRGSSFTLKVSDNVWRNGSNMYKLAQTMVDVYNGARSKFSVDEQRHYLFTPRDLTRWVLGLLRYDTNNEDLLDVFAYEGLRLFRDRLIDADSEAKFDSILSQSLRKDWQHRVDGLGSLFFSSLAGQAIAGESAAIKTGETKDDVDVEADSTAVVTGSIGARLARVSADDFEQVVAHGMVMYEREEKELNIKLFPEVLDNVARIDRVLSRPGGALLLVGSCGVGRRSAVTLVAHMQGNAFFSPTVVSGLGVGGEADGAHANKIFRADLKRVMAVAGVEGQGTVFLVEDHQITTEQVLETLNSLLSSGEVPGLYKHEELVPLLEPLRDSMEDAGGFRSPYEFFVDRVKRNLHVVVSMDPSNPKFWMRCESNPALFMKCAVQWMGEWSHSSMHVLPGLLLPKYFSKQIGAGNVESGKSKGGKSKSRGGRNETKEGKASDDDESGDDENKRGDYEVAGDDDGEGGEEETAGGGEGSNAVAGMDGVQTIDPEVLKDFAVGIHNACKTRGATPRDFVAFLRCYEQLYEEKAVSLHKKVKNFLGGLTKLRQAASTVDDLSAEATDQRVLLKQKQQLADKSMDEITEALQQASQTKKETVELSKELQIAEEETMKRKAAVEGELGEITPILDSAKEAVGKISSANLDEIRCLKMPPEPIHDVLSAVLMLLGIDDTSWLSMKRFLGNRGVKQDILNFDAHSIGSDIRKKVTKVLQNKSSSFEHKVIYRVSVAAAPLAAWVKANIRFSLVLQKIRPLEDELAEAKRSLAASQSRMHECEDELKQIETTVKKLQDNFKRLTRDAETLNMKLQMSEETLEKAQNLLGQLGGEQQRWEAQAKELRAVMETLPLHMLLAAAFTTYMGKAPEDVRQTALDEWKNIVGARTGDDGLHFDYAKIMSSESQMLTWKQQGLPGDGLSMQNAMMILHAGENNNNRCPLVIDPATAASAWLVKYLSSSVDPKHKTKRSPVEVVAQQDPRFVNQVELAVRFGKTLIVTEVDKVEPVLFPIIRRDLKHQGPRWVVQIGEKLIDYNEGFRLYLVTRTPEPELPPDAAALITVVNFTITRSGLEGQLLGVTVQHEQPELEHEKSRMLKQEEDFRVQLADLEKDLLDTLAESEGNLLENQALLDTLTKTKGKSAEVAVSLEASAKASIKLDEQRNQYRGFAKAGSDLFFTISQLSNLNHMYQFSLQSFVGLFRGSLREPMECKGVEDRTTKLAASLEVRSLHAVGRALFKADRQMFAVHLVHDMYPSEFGRDEWEYFIGDIVLAATGGDGIDDDKDGEGRSASAAGGGGNGENQLPNWAAVDRTSAFALLCQTFKRLVSVMQVNGSMSKEWQRWGQHAECEKVFPSGVRLTPFQRVLVVQTLRPDRLQSALAQFCCVVLEVDSLAPPPSSIASLHEITKETQKAQEEERSKSSSGGGAGEQVGRRAPPAVLMITTPGADPCRELAEYAGQVVGRDHYIELAMGGGQTEGALTMLRDAARVGDWLCLKNLHLVTGWLPRLEKELSTIEAHPNFCLWLTTEESGKFASILLQQSLKATFESPPGLKRNLERTYEAWPDELIEQSGAERAQLLFVLALIHALLQERRTYIPQGWTKFYEFSTGDLRSGTGVVELASKAFRGGNGRRNSDGEGSATGVDWQYVQGLMENSVYGGRIDNPFDLRVLRTYLKAYFSDAALSGRAELGRSGLSLPKPSKRKEDYVNWITRNLDDNDNPLLFGLPANIERSVQRANSANTITALRALSKNVGHATKFDRDLWLRRLGPFLKLWEKLTGGPNGDALGKQPSMESPGHDNDAASLSPVRLFVEMEEERAFKMITAVDASLRGLKQVVDGTALLTPVIQATAASLMRGMVPDPWSRKWEGPEEPKAWLRGLVCRKVALRRWVKRTVKKSLVGPDAKAIDLAELFNPGTFLNALRQESARKLERSMDTLRLVSKWDGPPRGAVLPVCVTGLSLQGAAFDGRRLSEPNAEATELVSVQDCFLAFVEGGDVDDEGVLNVPLYYSSSRERLLVELQVPSGDDDLWVCSGVGLFLKEA